MTLQIGQIINNRYRIDGLLGQGGFGAVYRAWDQNFELPCALKENTETGPDAQRQFLREARILHTLRHPSLPLVKDYFLIQDQGQYLVMDYIEGEDLQSILVRKGGALPEAQVLEWLSQICDALAYLHGQTSPVIHRDIKPANIKITPEGQAVLVDFGISKLYDPDLPTTQGARALTPGYSPFEQYGHAPTDARTDIYSLGATAYTLLTGRVPTESIARMAGQELPRPTTLNRALSAPVEQAVLRAMATMPAERYASAAEFRAALQASRAGVQRSQVAAKATAERREAPVVVPPPARPRAERPGSAPPPAAAKPAWRRVACLIVSLVGIAALVVVGLLAFQNYGLPDEVVPPVDVPALDGKWVGHIIAQSEGNQPFPLQVFIEQPPNSPNFAGTVVIEFPHEGRVEERRIVEGFFEGGFVHFSDERGLFFRGMLGENHIQGVAAWRCYDCDFFGDFELFRE